MAASDVDTLMTAAATAEAALDHATALSKARQAQAYLAAIPDSGDGIGATQTWRPSSIQDFIQNQRMALAAATGIQRQKYARTTKVSDPS